MSAAEASALKSSVEEQALAYFADRALLAKDPGACDPMKSFQVVHQTYGVVSPGDWRCRMHYWEMRFVQGLVSDAPDLSETCRSKYLNEHQLPPERIARVCAILIAGKSDPDRVTAEVAPLLFKPGDKASIEKTRTFFRALRGDSAGCAQLGNPAKREHCVAYARFALARAEGPRACADSEICRLLLGDPTVAANQGRAIEEKVCAESAAGAPPDAPGSPLDRAEAEIAAFEGPGRCGKSCRQGFDLDKYIAGRKGRAWLPGELGPLFTENALQYYQYAAVLAQDPEKCGALELMPADPNPVRARRESVEKRCERHYFQTSYAYALETRSPSFRAICQTWMMSGYPTMTPEDIHGVCGLVDSDRGDPAKLCRETMPLIRAESSDPKVNTIAECTILYRSINGDTAACDGLSDPRFADRCRGFAAFRRAYDRKDAGLCGTSVLCRLLMTHDAGILDGYARNAAAAACDPALSGAASLLDSAVKAGGPDREFAARAAALRDRFRRLRCD
ncbi:MAG TPA: hypothetical protein VH309_03385 [Elusimicrobiota bacterium]|nr:hypothetical protein [Elusimicrobiota bacterium]